MRKMMDRRLLMKTWLGIVGGMTFGTRDGKEAFAHSVSPQASGSFKLGLVTYNLAKDWDIPTLIQNCQQTGFEAVELRTTHRHGVEPSLTLSQRQNVKKQFAASPVRLLSLGSTCEYHSTILPIVRQECRRNQTLSSTGSRCRGSRSEGPPQRASSQASRKTRP